MQKLSKLIGREILDSRGNPTLEVDCFLDGGAYARASVPSGASTGSRESKELRDGEERYGGLGVLKAVKNLEKINGMLSGKEYSQEEFDEAMNRLDGTVDKSSLGANAILGASIAFCKACANEKGLEIYEHIGNISGNNKFRLPVPMLNVINGGKHADSGLDVQEFMIVPNAKRFSEKIEQAWCVIRALRKILAKKGFTVGLGDEGGFSPKLSSNEEALDILLETINTAGYSGELKIALDVAASEFFNDGKYNISIMGGRKLIDAEGLISWYKQISDKYQIFSIEDGLNENDWEGFKSMTSKLGDVKTVGDDLTVSHPEFIRKAGKERSIAAVIIKPNQIGSVSEAIEAIRIARDAGIFVIVSHRSGETCDSFIADFAVGTFADAIKAGSLARGERVSKYNRLLEIESILESKYTGA